MSKEISKSQAIQIIKDSDSLEILYDEIDRRDTESQKRSKIDRFFRQVRDQIKDQRDVKLISIKEK